MADTSTRSTILRIVKVIAWLSVLPAIVVSLARILHVEANRYLITLESTIPYLLLPAYGVAVLAGLTRKWVLLAVSVLLIICHLAWILPELTATRDLPADADARPALTVLSHNVKFDNDTPEDIAVDIRAKDPDVFLLQELTWKQLETLNNLGVTADYPYKFVKESGTDGLGMWSKYPLSGTELIQSPGFPLMRGVVEFEGGQIAIYNVHTQAPVRPQTDLWEGDLDLIRERMENETIPTFAAGDYNATWQHRPFRELLDAGYADAAADRGRGYSRTWPLDRFGGSSVGGLLRLDHVVTGPGLQARSIEELPGRGSDHKALFAQLIRSD